MKCKECYFYRDLPMPNKWGCCTNGVVFKEDGSIALESKYVHVDWHCENWSRPPTVGNDAVLDNNRSVV